MEIKIYIDVLLITNWIFNYLLLWLSSLLLGSRVSFLRLALGALLGALYAVCVFFLPDSWLYSLAGKLAIGMLMAALSFRPHCLRACLKSVCVLYVVTLLYGGTAFCLFFFSDAASLLGSVYRNGSLYVNVPLGVLLLLSVGCYLLLKVVFSLGACLSLRGKQIYKLRVIYRGQTLRLRAFYDSGNFLRDEISGKSVIITQWDVAKHLFQDSKTLKEALSHEPDFITLPYITLQGESLLAAFLPDAIYTENGRQVTQTKVFYIGLVDQTLDDYHNWDAILPHDFEGENQHEKHLDQKAADAV